MNVPGFRLLLSALLAAFALTGLARAEIVQQDGLRVVFDGGLTPHGLPRSGVAPIKVTMDAAISAKKGVNPPQLRQIAIAINRNGRFSPGGFPTCEVEDIQPATTAGALEACSDSLVGKGKFTASVLLPEQAPFPSEGKVNAFNGTFHGKPAILLHVYGTDPVPTSYTLPLEVSHTKGTFGILLSASLPRVTSEWGYVTGLSLTLGRTFRRHGEVHGYLSAGCPAPAGFPRTTFPFARASFGFAGKTLTSTLTRSCGVRGGGG